MFGVFRLGNRERRVVFLRMWLGVRELDFSGYFKFIILGILFFWVF